MKAKKEFYSHLSTYLAMSLFFFILNAMTNFGDWWFYWPMLGWGIGIASHYLSVFGFPGVGPTDKEWEEKTVQKELKRLAEEEPDDELELKELEKNKRSWDEDELV